MARELVLLRHGQSAWNLENRFTGWHDVDLSEKGLEEAQRAGELLVAEGLQFDHAYTSLLKRAIRTLWISLDALDQMWLPVTRDWALNERHYGALTGLDKVEAVKEHGEAQVHQWRRGFAVRPPALDVDDPRHPRADRRYKDIPAAILPATESLADTRERVMPFYERQILPLLKKGGSALVAAHGNSLRALLMHLDGLDEEAIAKVNVPTGFPLLFRFDDKMKVVERRYLGDEEEVRAAIEGVANQTKKS